MGPISAGDIAWQRDSQLYRLSASTRAIGVAGRRVHPGSGGGARRPQRSSLAAPIAVEGAIFALSAALLIGAGLMPTHAEQLERDESSAE